MVLSKSVCNGSNSQRRRKHESHDTHERQQVGLSDRTMRRIRDAIPMVTDRYADYKTDGLADAWAKMMLDRSGVDVPETKEKL